MKAWTLPSSGTEPKRFTQKRSLSLLPVEPPPLRRRAAPTPSQQALTWVLSWGMSYCFLGCGTQASRCEWCFWDDIILAVSRLAQI